MGKEVAQLISYSDSPLCIADICVQSMSRLWSFHFQLRICIIYIWIIYVSARDSIFNLKFNQTWNWRKLNLRKCVVCPPVVCPLDSRLGNDNEKIRLRGGWQWKIRLIATTPLAQWGQFASWIWFQAYTPFIVYKLRCKNATDFGIFISVA